MAKTICSHCGYKNKGSVSICSSCGYYLLDSQLGTQQSVSSHARFAGSAGRGANSPPPGTSGTGTASGSTIEVRSRTGMYRWLPTAASLGPFVVFILLEYFANLQPIYVIPFLFAIMFLSPMLRRNVAGIRFFAKGFSVRNAGRDEIFYYDSIERASVSKNQSGMQLLTMSLAGSTVPVSLAFDSGNTFRMVLMQLKRRRIEVASDQTTTPQDQTVI